MELTTRARIERDLPPIWTTEKEREEHPEWGVYNTQRIEWYTSLTQSSGLILGGRSIIPEFIAAMIQESGLDNLEPGNNAKNGANNPYLGTGWCQLDTGYHVVSIDQMHILRADPLASLQYVAQHPDLTTHGRLHTEFNKQRWHAWELENIDPHEGWSPLEAAYTAWDKVQGEPI